MMQKLISTESDVIELLNQIKNTTSRSATIVVGPLSKVMLVLDKVIRQAQVYIKNQIRLSPDILEPAGFAVWEYLNIVGEFNEPLFINLLLEKHSRYGAEPILSWGLVGIMIRVDSKYCRVKNLVSGECVPSIDESFKDTLMDILGYCVLGLALKER